MAMPNIQGMDTEYKPWGGLAGIMTGERESLQHFANLQGMEESQLDNIVKQVAASRAANDFSDPRMEMLRQQGIMGDNMTKDAQGRLKQATLATDITAGNAKNQATQSGHEIDSMIDGMDQASAMIEANGPAGMAMVMQRMPPQLQQIMQQAGPQAPQVLKKLSEMLKYQRSQTPKHIGEMEKEAFTQEGRFITEDMKEQEANSRNNADNAARSADRAAAREATAASKESSEAMRKEAELTRRMEHGRGKLKLLQDEFKQVDEAISTPVFGLTKEEKAARKLRLEKQKKDIQDSAKTIAAELDRLGSLSTFASGAGTAAKPIKLD